MLDPVHDSLVKYIRAMTRNREETKDILGETLLVAFKRIDEVNKPEPFGYFLFTIARRVFARMKWRRRLFSAVKSEQMERCWDQSTSPDMAADRDILYSVLKLLPERQREAIVLFELSGFSLDEIRLMQGGSLSGVKSRFARGRAKLTTALRDNPASWESVNLKPTDEVGQ